MPASSLPTCSAAPASTHSPPDKFKRFQSVRGGVHLPDHHRFEGDKETIETIGETNRKSSPATNRASTWYNLQVHPTTRTGCPPPGRLTFAGLHPSSAFPV